MLKGKKKKKYEELLVIPVAMFAALLLSKNTALPQAPLLEVIT